MIPPSLDQRAQSSDAQDSRAAATPGMDRNWYAVSTLCKHEKSAAKHLDQREVEVFLPTYETTRLWKNRQQVKLTLPLFPTYLFVRIGQDERLKTLEAPGTVSILGNSRGPLAIPAFEIDFLRRGVAENKAEPYQEPILGERVEIKRGAMKGLRGALVRKNKRLRFVLEIELLNQRASVEISAEDLVLAVP